MRGQSSRSLTLVLDCFVDMPLEVLWWFMAFSFTHIHTYSVHNCIITMCWLISIVYIGQDEFVFFFPSFVSIKKRICCVIFFSLNNPLNFQ